MRREKKMPPTTIRLDPDVKAGIEKLAAGEDRSVSNLINRVLRDYIALAVDGAGDARHVVHFRTSPGEAPEPSASGPGRASKLIERLRPGKKRSAR